MEKLINFNGMRVIEGWPYEVARAQKMTTYVIDGIPYARRPYEGDWVHDEPKACRDCSVMPGQIHVSKCCVERCPKCGGQYIGCECGGIVGISGE